MKQSGCTRASVRMSVCKSVSPFIPLYLLNEWRYFNETDRSHQYQAQVHDTNDIENVTGERSRSSCSDGRRNVVNATASEPLQKFRPIPTKKFPGEVGPRNNQVLRSWVQRSRSHKRRRHIHGRVIYFSFSFFLCSSMDVISAFCHSDE